MESAGRALLVNDDLFFSGRLVSVLAGLGYLVQVVASAEAALESVRREAAGLVIVNANSRTIVASELIRRLRDETTGARIIAFISHTRIPEVREEIIGAGADRLCANSAITMRLPDIVRSVAAAEGGPKVEE